MSEQTPQFRLVRRGYDPAEVDARLNQLSDTIEAVARQRDSVAEQLRTAQAETIVAPVSEPADFEHLGQRIGMILSLARDEAAELKKKTEEELEVQRLEFAQQVETIRETADQYASDTRRDADTDAKRIVAEARRKADEIVEAAERDAAARMQEANAAYEEQRAINAKAASDFEATLSARRKQAEAEFAAALAEANAKLDDANKTVDAARAEADLTRKEAQLEARRLIDNAELQAQSVIGDAKAVAARVRADSDRELAAATQRRDSINAQLANVRQMLANVTTLAPAVGDLAAALPPEAPHATAPAPEPVAQAPEPADDYDTDQAGDDEVDPQAAALQAAFPMGITPKGSDADSDE